jgi:hypothetical protein
MAFMGRKRNKVFITADRWLSLGNIHTFMDLTSREQVSLAQLSLRAQTKKTACRLHFLIQ